MMKKPRTISAVAGVCVLAICTLQLAGAQADGDTINVGSLKVAGSFWNFDTSADLGGQSWVSVTVTNTACFAGPNDPRAGTAHAGAIAFYGQLQPIPTATGLTVYNGDLVPIEGTKAAGNVRVVTGSGDGALTQVDATIWGLDEFTLDNTLSVCLQPG